MLNPVTERIRPQTEVLLGPLRPTALLAKQAATLDVLSGGRFRLGIGIDGRADDHAAAGVLWHRRGALLDRQSVDLRRIWRGEPFAADDGDAGMIETPEGAAAPTRANGVAGGVIGPVPLTPGGPRS